MGTMGAAAVGAVAGNHGRQCAGRRPAFGQGRQGQGGRSPGTGGREEAQELQRKADETSKGRSGPCGRQISANSYIL